MNPFPNIQFNNSYGSVKFNPKTPVNISHTA